MSISSKNIMSYQNRTKKEVDGFFKGWLGQLREIDTLNIFLTRTCNMSCSYCYFKKVINERKTQQYKLLKEIDFVTTHCKIRNIVFSGGEPLLKYGLIKKIVSYLVKKNDFKFSRRPK